MFWNLQKYYIVYMLYIIYLLVLYSKPQLTDGVQVSYTNIYLKNRTSFFNEKGGMRVDFQP